MILRNEGQERLESHKIRKHPNMRVLPIFLALVIQLASFFDMGTDIVITLELANSTSIAWPTFSICTIIAPYYMIYMIVIRHQLKLMRS